MKDKQLFTFLSTLSLLKNYFLMKYKLNKILSQTSNSNADLSHTNSWGHKLYFKSTQEWEFFWLRFWILYYFIVSYVKILRFCKILPVLEEVRFFRVVLGLRGMKKIFELGQKNIFFFFFLLRTLYMS